MVWRVAWLDDPSDADIEAVAALITVMVAEAIPGEPPEPPGDLADQVRRPIFTATRLGVVRDPADTATLLGAAKLEVRLGADNQRTVWVPALVVSPPARRQGIGGALLDASLHVAAADGRRHAIVSAVDGHRGAEALARRTGARRGLIEAQNRLTVADVDGDLLARWMADAPEGYTLLTWDDPAPRELVEPMCLALRSMNDAPMSAELEPFLYTPEEYWRNQEQLRARGHVGWVACARHDASGEIAGYTELGFDRHRRWLAGQGDTCVTPDHRGKRIGRWVKAANLLRLRAERPDVTAVDTWNAATNEHMLAINHELGFRRIAAWREWELTIPAPTAEPATD